MAAPIHRLAALSGLAYALLVFLGSAAIGGTSGAGRHSLDASIGDVADYLARADPGRVWAGEFVAALGYGLFLVFAALSWRLLGRADERAAGGALAAATVYVTLSLVATACLAPALNREGDAVDAARFLDLRSVLIAMAFLFFAAWLGATAVRALRAATMPRWLAWTGLAIAVLQLLGTPFTTVDPAFTGVPTFAGFLWVAVVSVLIARRPAPAS